MLFRLISDLFADRSRPPAAARPAGAEEIASHRSSPRTWLRYAQSLEDAGDVAAALESYRACAEAWPADVDAQLAIGNALAALWRMDECVSAFAGALAKAPGNTEIYSGLLLYSHYASTIDPRRLFELHRGYDRVAGHLAPPDPAHTNTPEPGRPLRIGYVSRNFSLHSVGYFIEPVIAAHDRGAFSVYCYHTHPRTDATTARISRLAGAWRHVADDTAETLAARIRADRIDILVDLGGHTKLNHLPVFARRPAPVQATWLGYPDTTGLSTMDYRVSDTTADPAPLADALNSERLLRLPAPFLCYRPPDDSPGVSPRPADEPIVFGSCNVLFKVNPPLIALWAQILKAVPGSRLLLKSKLLQTGEVVDRLLDAFQTFGIGADRLDLRGWAANRADHLSVYNEIDVALDTYPYNGTTTTCEALWMGVPVVTRAGDTHMSRVGATLLQAVALPDLVGHSDEAYVRAAVGLAEDGGRRRALRSGLRAKLAASALLDSAGFARHLETAYRDIWQTWCSGRTAR